MQQTLSIILIGVFISLLMIYRFIFVYFKKTEKKLEESFKAISFDVLQNTLGHQKSTIEDLDSRKKEIEALISPLKETIAKLDSQGNELEKKRELAYQSLTDQIKALIVSEQALLTQTTNLTKAFSSPNIRGNWGQVHLRRVVELAGLLNHCDFSEQLTVVTEGKISRPDLVIHLPGDRNIIVDAKTPLEAYLEATHAKDEKIYLEKLKEHAIQIKRHLKDLSSKEYWNQFERSPEYVILFLPAEAFFSNALVVDPLLIEVGIDQNVIIATPTTLIAILRAVALGWKQESLSKNAKEISLLGKELYERIATLSDYWKKLGKSLSLSVDAYNQATSSLESRVLSSARKFENLGAGSSKEISELELLDQIPKTFRSEELIGSKDQ